MNSKRKKSSSVILGVAIMLFVIFSTAPISMPFSNIHALCKPEISSDNIFSRDKEEGTCWFLAEGYTGGEFDTWVLVQNPNDEEASVTLEFQLPEGSAADPFSFNLPARSRRSVKLNDIAGLEATDVSTAVSSDKPVVAERAMYFDYEGKAGGHDSLGVAFASNVWFLAEGYTGGEFDTWVLVQNPNDEEASVTLEFQLPEGSAADPFSFNLPARSRRSVKLNDIAGLESTDVSTKVSSTVQVVAERAVYFNYSEKSGGHASVGVTYPNEQWFLAEGYTGGEFDTWVLVQNPNDEEASVTLEFQLPEGSAADPFSFNLPARSRRSVKLNDIAGLEATDVSTAVSSDKPVVAERAMYFDYFEKVDGHDSIGITYPEYELYLAEGYTGGEFDTWVLVQNPWYYDSEVTLEFQLPEGNFAEPYMFTLPAHTRKSIKLNDLAGLEATDVSTKVIGTEPVCAERAMYFNYEGRSGGHNSVAYSFKPPIIPETTKVMDAETCTKLLSISQSGRNLLFSSRTGFLDELEADDVLIAPSISRCPNGFIGKVVSVEDIDEKFEVITTKASLSEGLHRGNFSLSKTLSGNDAASVKTLIDGVDFKTVASESVKSKTISLNLTVEGEGGSLEIEGSIGIDVDLSFNADIDVTWKWKKLGPLWVKIPIPALKSLSFVNTVTENLDIELKPSANLISVKKEIEVAKFVFPPITIAIPPFLPIVFVPELSIVVGVEGKVEAGITVGVTQSGTYKAGLSYTNGSFTPLKETDVDFDPRLEIDAGASIKAYAGPQVSLLLYGLVGPYAAIQGYLELAASLTQNPWWTLHAGIEALLGVKLEVLSYDLVNFSTTVIDLKTLLAQAPHIESISPSSGPAGSEVTIRGSGFGKNRSAFGSNVTFDGKQSPNYMHWSDGEIKCRVPSGISGNVKVYVNTLTRSNSKTFTVTAGPDGPGTWKPQNSGTSEHFYGVSALSANDVWAITTSGNAFHYDGSSWTGQPTGTSFLYDISAAAPNRVWAVGYQGRIRCYNGSTWTDQSISTTKNFHSVFALDSNNVWAVGEGGMIYFYNGSNWTAQDSQTNKDLHSVMASDANNVWAVGSGGTVLLNRGSGWSKVPVVHDDNYGDVWTLGDSEILTKSGNCMYYYDGKTWTVEPTGFSEGLVSIAGIADDRVWIGCWYGLILYWNGSEWTHQKVADDTVDIRDIEILDVNNMWAVGLDGTILYNDGN